MPEVTATRCRVKWCRRTRFQPGAAPCATPASVPRCDSVTSNSPWCAGATPLWCARNPPFPDTPCTCASISSCHPPGATRCHLHGWPTCGLKMIGSLHTVRRDAVCLAVNCVWAHARLVRFGDQAFRALDDWLLMDRETVVSSAVLGRLGSVARRDAQVATSAAVGGVVYISPAAPCWCSFDEGSVPGTPPAADRSISPWGVRGFKLRLLRNPRREGTSMRALSAIFQRSHLKPGWSLALLWCGLRAVRVVERRLSLRCDVPLQPARADAALRQPHARVRRAF